MPPARIFDRLFVVISACSLIPFCFIVYDDVRDLLTREVSQLDYPATAEVEVRNASEADVEEWVRSFCSNRGDDAETGSLSGSEADAPSCADRHRDIYAYHRYRELLSQAPPEYIYPAPVVVILTSLIPAANLAGLMYFALKAAKELLTWVWNHY